MKRRLMTKDNQRVKVYEEVALFSLNFLQRTGTPGSDKTLMIVDRASVAVSSQRRGNKRNVILFALVFLALSLLSSRTLIAAEAATNIMFPMRKRTAVAFVTGSSSSSSSSKPSAAARRSPIHTGFPAIVSCFRKQCDDHSNSPLAIPGPCRVHHHNCPSAVLPSRQPDGVGENGDEYRETYLNDNLSSWRDTDRGSNSNIRASKEAQLNSAGKLSLAPMMDYTDRHFRHVVRLISSRTLLYSEMVAANAVAHERRDVAEDYLSLNPHAAHDEIIRNYDASYLRRFVGQGMVIPREGPSVLQLGGSDPRQMEEATRTVMELTHRGYVCNYTALNLNCGCPSPKVAGKGCFGAALMDEPKLVRRLVRSMHMGCGGTMPITVKCRIGTDTTIGPLSKANGCYDTVMDPEKEYDTLCKFIETVASDGIVRDFQIHARIAVLNRKFSPDQNRKIPPLKYDIVRRLVKDYPDLTFTLNGGIETLSQVKEELDRCPGLRGVMIGRAWAANPWSFAMADKLLYEDEGEDDDGTSFLGEGYRKPRNRLEVLEQYGRHADAEEEMWDPVKIRRFLIQAITPLFAGEPNGKRYRIALDEIAGLPKKLAKQGRSMTEQPPLSELILNAAAEHLSEDVLLRTPEESYEKILWEEQRQKSKMMGGGEVHETGNNNRSRVVMEWQSTRKVEEEKRKEAAGEDNMRDEDFSHQKNTHVSSSESKGRPFEGSDDMTSDVAATVAQ